MNRKIIKWLIILDCALLSLGSRMAYAQKTEEPVQWGIEDSLKKKAYEKAHIELSNINLNEDNLYYTVGTASWYGKKFNNRKTANGEVYNMYDYTAAHKDLPFGTILKVTNTENELSVLVRVNDRGPFVGKRVLDLSYNAAMEIGSTGLSKVIIEGFVPGSEAATDMGTEQTTNTISEKLTYSISEETLANVSSERLNKTGFEKGYENNTEGSMEKGNLDSSKLLDKYYFGYSTCLPLACLHESEIFIIGYTQDFNEAVKYFKSYLSRHKETGIYLVIPAEEIIKKDGLKESRFYLAILTRTVRKFNYGLHFTN